MNNRQLYLRLLGYVRPYWRRFSIAVGAMVITALTEPAMPALIKPLLDRTFVARDPQWIRLMPLVLVALFLVRGVAQYASSVSLAWVASKVVFDLRERMFARLIDLPVNYYAKHTAGELMSRLSYDVNQVTVAATNALVVAVRDSLAVIGLLAWMLYLDWHLALVFLLVAPVISIIVKLISGRLRRMSRSLQRFDGKDDRRARRGDPRQSSHQDPRRP